MVARPWTKVSLGFSLVTLSTRRCGMCHLNQKKGNHFGSSFPSSDLVGIWPNVFVSSRSCLRPFALHQLSRRATLHFQLHQCMCYLFSFQLCAVVAFCHSLLDFSQQLPIYCGLKVGMSCNDMDAFESHLAFSRRAVRGQFAIQFMLCALQFQFLAAVYLWFQDLVA